MFTNILVATDLSETSGRALAVAVQLARDHGAALRILHVVHDVASEPWAIEAAGVDFGALTAEVRDRAERDLAACVARINPAPERMTAEVLVGRPAAEIIRRAADLHADLVVVGSHGRGPLGRVFLGSVADRVLRESGCPVLVVRPAPAAAAVHNAA